METFGTKEHFGILVRPASGQMRQVEVWAGGKNLTPVDSSSYIPSFSHSLAKSANHLKNSADFFAYEPLFSGLAPEAAFAKLSRQEAGTEQAWSALRFADWGPTTDDFLCFLLPLNGKLHLAFCEHQSNLFHELLVEPSEIADILEGALNALSHSV